MSHKWLLSIYNTKKVFLLIKYLGRDIELIVVDLLHKLIAKGLVANFQLCYQIRNDRNDLFLQIIIFDLTGQQRNTYTMNV